MKKLINKAFSLSKNPDFAVVICFTAAIVFFVWRASFGFGLDDESWYMTMTHRMMMGDSLLTDEWNVAQLFSFLLYVPFKIYMAIAGTTDGIVLFYRYLFILLQGSAATLIYIRLRRYGFVAILAGLVLFFNIPMTIMAPSYYAMGIAFVMMSGLLLATVQPFKKITFFFAGMLFACAVLCNPVLVLVYLIYSFCMILREKTKNRQRALLEFTEFSFSFKAWMWLTFGVASVAALFLIFIFSKTSLKEILENLPMIFQDPDYRLLSNTSGKQNVFTFKETLLAIIKINPYIFGIFILLFAAVQFDKNKEKRRHLYLAAGAAAFCAYVLYIVLTTDFPRYGYTMLPLAMFGFLCYILMENRNNQMKSLFVFLWISSVLYFFCLDITSDVGYWTACLALTVSSPASVIFIYNTSMEIMSQKKRRTGKRDNSRKKILAVALSAAIIFQLGQEIYLAADLKLNSDYLVVYTEEMSLKLDRRSKEKLDITLNKGPEKGIKTTADRAKLYLGTLNDLAPLKDSGQVPVLVAANMPWCYLYLDMPYATFSSWFLTDIFEEMMPRLLDYYKLHPDKSPKYIYVSKYTDLMYLYFPSRAKEMVDEFADMFKVQVRESEFGYVLTVL